LKTLDRKILSKHTAAVAIDGFLGSTKFFRNSLPRRITPASDWPAG
jgi:hypothetical protein